MPIGVGCGSGVDGSLVWLVVESEVVVGGFADEGSFDASSLGASGGGRQMMQPRRFDWRNSRNCTALRGPWGTGKPGDAFWKDSEPWWLRDERKASSVVSTERYIRRSERQMLRAVIFEDNVVLEFREQLVGWRLVILVSYSLIFRRVRET